MLGGQQIDIRRDIFMEINQFYTQLDQLFSTGQIERAGDFIQESKKQARQEKDYAALLSIINESMGYYRSIGKEDALIDVKEAIELIGTMGLTGTVHEGTTLLNVATAYRAFGKLEESCLAYQKALEIYQKELGDTDYRLAGLYNNISSLYADKEEFGKSIEALVKALAILKQNKGTEVEQAISLTNLAVSYLRNKQIEEAERAIHQALALFESQPGERDAHYGMALAGQAEIYYVKREYIDAIQMYSTALEEIRRCYGESLTYATALENCANICITAGYTEDAKPLLLHAMQIREVAKES